MIQREPLLDDGGGASVTHAPTRCSWGHTIFGADTFFAFFAAMKSEGSALLDEATGAPSLWRGLCTDDVREAYTKASSLISVTESGIVIQVTAVLWKAYSPM